jgi:small nuclear ribonucleoprotein D3
MSGPQFGAPISLLHEADGFIVSVELKSGESSQGTLQGSEDSMNCELADVTYTDRHGAVSHLDSVYIRGSSILFFVIPEMFANAPIFREDTRAVKGQGDGYAGNLRDKSFADKIRMRYR